VDRDVEVLSRRVVLLIVEVQGDQRRMPDPDAAAVEAGVVEIRLFEISRPGA